MSNAVVEPVHSRQPEGQGSGLLPQSVIGLIAIVLVAIPLVPMVLQSFLDKPLYYPDAAFTFENFTRFVTDPEIRDSLGTTVIYAVVAVVLSMVLGTALALLVGRTDLPGRGWISQPASLAAVPVSADHRFWGDPCLRAGRFRHDVR